MWRGRSAWWRFGLVSFWLWATSFVVAVGTVFGLPAFRPGAARSGCYITDALFVFVKCADDLPGGRLIEAYLNFTWWLIGGAWGFGRLPWPFNAHAPKLFWIALLIVWAATQVGAVGFMIAFIWNRIRRSQR